MFDFYDLNDQINFDEEEYFHALNSLINKTDENDIEPDDTESELSEVSELDEDFYQVIGQDTNSKLTFCILIDYINGIYQTCGQIKVAEINWHLPRFSCGNYFVDKDGHLYTKPGKAKFGEDKFKNKTLAAIAPSIFQILQEIRPTKHTSKLTISESVSEEIPDVPSLFIVAHKNNATIKYNISN
ncbi:hypothetical protein C1646_750021 [Rhizophagus diaphanus]|nr:hypothetical protein C1646_750021 [Rhizophagus diaphanus] [Rhizophagus sp. MUCL 43196]